MITFETQESFEEAVMTIVQEKLRVRVGVLKDRKCYYGDDEYTKVTVALRVEGDRNSFSIAEDQA